MQKIIQKFGLASCLLLSPVSNADAQSTCASPEQLACVNSGYSIGFTDCAVQQSGTWAVCSIKDLETAGYSIGLMMNKGLTVINNYFIGALNTSDPVVFATLTQYTFLFKNYNPANGFVLFKTEAQTQLKVQLGQLIEAIKPIIGDSTVASFPYCPLASVPAWTFPFASYCEQTGNCPTV